MQQLELLGRNGAGANSTVYKCRNKVFGDLVAVKKLEGATVQQALQEAAIMRICAHENCVTLLEVQQGISTGTVFLVMENVGHSLSREFLLNPRGLPLCKAKFITFQLAQALEHIHNMKFIHGDIKPANILLTSQYNVKLCDFGSASSAVTSSYEEQNTAVFGVLRTPIGLVSSYPTPDMGPAAAGVVRPTAAASCWYCAPESLLGAHGSPASDIWALGCVLVELVTGRPLMPGGDGELNQLSLVVSMIGALSPGQERLLQLLPAEQRASVEAARARGPLLDKIPKLAACPPLLDVVRACLHPDPAARPTARELQSMPFFEDLRAALQASKEAAADVKTRGGSPPSQLSRRSSSGNMDVDMRGPPDTAAMAVSMDRTQAWPAAPADAAKDGATKEGSKTQSAVMPPAASQTPLRRVGGVQAAAPMRPASRSRVSALTATIRGNPFDDDTSYTDLMPQVLELVAQWEEERWVEALGPIAVAARRRNSSCFTSPRTPPSGGVSDKKESRPTPAAVVTIAGGTVSSMASSPCAPAAIVMAPVSTVVATPAVSLAVKATTPVSVSVGALSCLVKAAGLRPYSPAAAAVAIAASKPTPALLRSRAILNRARRHYNRETRFGPDCMSIFGSSCPRDGLGNGASLLQQELSMACGDIPVRRLKLSSAQGSRRSFADLMTLTSVGDHGTLRCETPAEGKRRRGLVAVSSQTSLISQGSLLMEPSLGSLRENSPYLGRASPLFGASSRRMRRSNSINGLAAGSPVRPDGWQGMLPGGAGVIGVVAARAVNIPQPGAGRNRHARI